MGERTVAVRSESRDRGRTEPRMPLRDSDLRSAAFEDQLRPGDPSWNLLRELQKRRDRANGRK